MSLHARYNPDLSFQKTLPVGTVVANEYHCLVLTPMDRHETAASRRNPTLIGCF